MAFYTIFISPGLSKRDYRQAVSAAPRAAALRRDQQTMLRSAGFDEVAETDVTVEYLRTARDWIVARERHAAQLRRSSGQAEFEAKQADSKAHVAAIEQGLLRRSLFVAKRP